MEKKTKILFVSSEVQPFCGTGGLGDVMGSLPHALNATGKAEVRVVLPLYESMAGEYKNQLKFEFSLEVPVSWRKQYCGVFSLRKENTVYYLIDNEYYFKRYNLYGYYDDGERFTFFSRAVPEILDKLDFMPDVIHCHDWHTALVPVYMKLFYSSRYPSVKTVFTIHNIEYQGQFPLGIGEDLLGISNHDIGILEYGGCINFMKGGIEACDALTTVSPTYALELTEPYHAYGLDAIIRRNKGKMTGIMNGIDEHLFDPATNPSLFFNYDSSCFEKKVLNKTELQKMVGLPVDKNIPLIGMVTRLAAHKGLELLKFALHDILKSDVQLVLLGTGSPSLEDYFRHIQMEFDKRISAVIAYNKDLSQKIYAGADLFLMPSKSEPCGLSQMIACKYGTLPIVRACGGLKDSIKDIDGGDGIGFVFENFDVLALNNTVDRAIKLYNNDRATFEAAAKRAMGTDFSWNKSANAYIALYDRIIEK